VGLNKLWWGLAAVPLVLGGCSALGLGTPTPDPSASPTPAAGGPGWIVVATGSASAAPSLSPGGSRPPMLPAISFAPIGPGCAQTWDMNAKLIPLTVVPGKRSVAVTWPRQWDSNYRVAAVPQVLVSGKQPTYPWMNIAPASGCTVSATITGLKSGAPYVIWLDAPNTGYERDGSRHPQSGRSGVIYPL
jgi:hypothetical protein